MNRFTSSVGFAGLLVVGFGVALHADDGGLKDACSADVQKYCSSVQPGAGRIAACLKENQGNLSSSCQSGMQQVKEKIQQGVQNFQAACAADAHKFCSDIAPGGGRIIVCLKQHRSDLSPDCQQAMAKMPGHRRGGTGDGSNDSKAQAPAGENGDSPDNSNQK